MKLITITLTLTALIFGLAVCLPAGMADDSTYYTQTGFYYEKGRHITTNYQKGTRVSVNTPIKLLEMGNKRIKIILVDKGEVITIVNKKNYTKATTAEIFDRMFAKKKVNLSVYSKKTQRNIKFGVVTPGMTKKTVLRTMGYPPAHETPTTDMDKWTYWMNRFNRTVVYFSDGKVTAVQN